MSRPRVSMLSVGSGNEASLSYALHRAGVAFDRAETPQAIRDAGAIILPGVGCFTRVMSRLHDRSMVDALHDRANAGVPILGVCVGMQVLADEGDEGAIGTPTRGLGLIPGRVERIEALPGRRVPHMGWNRVIACAECPLLDGLDAEPAMYFVHSYHFRAHDPRHVLAEVNDGSPIAAIVGRDNILGVQCHPEKSQHDGERLLANFAAWAHATA